MIKDMDNNNEYEKLGIDMRTIESKKERKQAEREVLEDMLAVVGLVVLFVVCVWFSEIVSGLAGWFDNEKIVKG